MYKYFINAIYKLKKINHIALRFTDNIECTLEMLAAFLVVIKNDILLILMI